MRQRRWGEALKNWGQSRPLRLTCFLMNYVARALCRDFETVSEVLCGDHANQHITEHSDLRRDSHILPSRLSLICCRRLPTCLGDLRLPVVWQIKLDTYMFRMGNLPSSFVSLQFEGR